MISLGVRFVVSRGIKLAIKGAPWSLLKPFQIHANQCVRIKKIISIRDPSAMFKNIVLFTCGIYWSILWAIIEMKTVIRVSIPILNILSANKKKYSLLSIISRTRLSSVVNPFISSYMRIGTHPKRSGTKTVFAYLIAIWVNRFSNTGSSKI